MIKQWLTRGNPTKKREPAALQCEVFAFRPWRGVMLAAFALGDPPGYEDEARCDKDYECLLVASGPHR
jgi:hypothetical protein